MTGAGVPIFRVKETSRGRCPWSLNLNGKKKLIISTSWRRVFQPEDQGVKNASGRINLICCRDKRKTEGVCFVFCLVLF